MISVLCVGLGGGLGAICRYLISLLPVRSDFPVLTLVTNLLGAIIIGIIVGVTEKNDNVSEKLVLFLKTGFCGGFTTFSTFSLETYKLFENSRYLLGTLYAALSLGLCIGGVWFGKKIAGK